MTHTLSIDIEDFSPIDVKYGVFKRSEQGEIILLAYSLDYAPPVVIDLLSGEKLPNWFIPALTDPNYIKKAYNAPYERAYLNKQFKIYTPPEQWECTLVRAAMCGLPLSLDDSSKALGLIEKKDPIGKALIRYFCIPCKPTATNGMRTRNLPEHEPEKWEQFKSYNGQDVVVEQEVDKACQWYKIPEQEHLIWCLNELKNERGIKVDIDLIDSAMILDQTYRAQLTAEAIELTGLKNVNSPAQLKKWLELETEDTLDNLNKQTVNTMLLDIGEGPAKRILQIRQLMSRSSIKKYASMKAAAGADHRVRGLTQYYGANRTGREAGRIFNGQNFPRIQEWFEGMLNDTRELVKRRDIDSLHFIFPNLSDVLSQLLRPTFIAEKGKEYIVLDFSSIESLGLACFADEKWRIDFFRTGGDIYKASGAIMFHTPIGQITKDQRQKSKIAELLCGYAGGVGAMERNNATIEDPAKRIPSKEIPGLIKTWREANPNIVQLWREMDAAAKTAINTGTLVPVKNGVAFGMKAGNLLMRLPSGRCLVYQKPHLRKFYVANIPVTTFDEEKQDYVTKTEHIEVGEVRKHTMDEYYWHLSRLNLVDDGTPPKLRESICFWGQNQTTKKWEPIKTWGGRFVENLVQAACRDLLMHSVITVEKAGYPVVLTVHDEIVVEVPVGSVSFERLKELLLDMPAWAKHWPVKADGFVGSYYKK